MATASETAPAVATTAQTLKIACDGARFAVESARRSADPETQRLFERAARVMADAALAEATRLIGG